VINPELARRLNSLLVNLPSSPESWKKRFNLVEGTTFRYGKISRIPDKEGKTRIITVLNYWTQSALKPLHDTCEGILKKLP
jgi:hypothetical protein